MPATKVRPYLANLERAADLTETVTAAEAVPSASEGVDCTGYTHCRVLVHDGAAAPAHVLTSFNAEAWCKNTTVWAREVDAGGAYLDMAALTTQGFSGLFVVSGARRFKFRMDTIVMASGAPAFTIHYTLFNLLGS